VSAHGGAAADFHMPSADAARPGAERRARAAAEAKLRAALQALPLGGRRKLVGADLDAALASAQAARVDYQSNGGALLTPHLMFKDVAAPNRQDKRPVHTLTIKNLA